MKFARGTPWGFIAVNAAAAIGVVLLGLVTVTKLRPAGAGPFPSLATDWMWVLLSGLAIEWVNLLVFFFRDPDRTVGRGVVSPADGRVRAAQASGHSATISIVLAATDVHVVRSPIKGRIRALEHKPGGKRFAFSKDSHLNERLEVLIDGEGESCTLTLIAGAFADRIVAYLESGAPVEKGERLGIIKFGSRVDLDYDGASALSLRVKVSSTVIAGETTIIVPAGEAQAA